MEEVGEIFTLMTWLKKYINIKMVTTEQQKEW